MTPKKINNSPFRYPGGKFYARKIILKNLPKHNKYVELFAGGASIFFAKEKAELNILNDLDSELMNCYLIIRDNVEGLIEKLKGIQATKELHRYYKNEFKPGDKLERAFRYYYLNRTSYSGIMKTANCYFGYGEKYSMRPENWPFHLRTCSQKLQNVILLNKDFEEVLYELEDGCFIFIDPPYFNADQDKFYNCTFSKEDHYRLARALKSYKSNFKFLITYDNCEEISDTYSWCNQILPQEWNYTIARTDDQKNKLKLEHGFIGSRTKGKEIFISNYNQEKAIGVREIKYTQVEHPELSFKL
ncbi:MAG: DNA adenine methylase [Leptospiraceae bacterium]|nr:DNA adenine methylase [Leptospiraceae bacterium]